MIRIRDNTDVCVRFADLCVISGSLKFSALRSGEGIRSSRVG
jgi:hypothetical protein